MANDGTIERRRPMIRVISRHSTEAIADHHRAALERLQEIARTDSEPNVALRTLAEAGVGPQDDLTTRHERFRRLKWAVGVFV